MKPELAQFESDNEKVNLVKINIDEKDTAEFKKYEKFLEKIEAIPAMFVLGKDGEILTEFVGFKDAKELETMVESTR
jgi:thioredoxin-like negative regulator of GroEL